MQSVCFACTKNKPIFIGKEIVESTQQRNCSIHVEKMPPSKFYKFIC